MQPNCNITSFVVPGGLKQPKGQLLITVDHQAWEDKLKSLKIFITETLILCYLFVLSVCQPWQGEKLICCRWGLENFTQEKKQNELTWPPLFSTDMVAWNAVNTNLLNWREYLSFELLPVSHTWTAIYDLMSFAIKVLTASLQQLQRNNQNIKSISEKKIYSCVNSANHIQKTSATSLKD